MKFREYQHIERFGMPEVEFIEQGRCYIFPKIDGTNVSVWLGDDGQIHAGGRHRELSLENDNAGFFAYIREHNGIKAFLQEHPSARLYGEWLVPHSLETYRDDCWNRFYVFDVVMEFGEDVFGYVPYFVYKSYLDICGIDYLPPLAVIDNPTKEQLISYLDKNIYPECLFEWEKEAEGNWLTLSVGSNKIGCDWRVYIENIDRCGIDCIHIQYVHQLQNFLNILNIEMEAIV